MPPAFTSLELCAGAGGQALGLEMAGFHHVALVEADPHACATLRLNRPCWNVIETDLNYFEPDKWPRADLVAAGLPCPPFSVAGKQLGEADERNLFPAALRVIERVRPKAVLIENVRGFLDPVFESYRAELKDALARLGYLSDWRLLNASDYGVPQLRPRVAIVALRKPYWRRFEWPEPPGHPPPTVGETLYPLMSAAGWRGAKFWRKRANQAAPTLVGGSKKHGGPDLGPTRAKKAWAALGVDGRGIADAPPARDFAGMPRLTVEMAALLQGFPPEWKFSGRKTNAYRQVGNAFPPPVARALARSIAAALA